ncbi:MAG: AbgT family transporter [Bacteroidia bacterium]|nr:AbgT family transporter [Bacteroidia bacterium]
MFRRSIPHTYVIIFVLIILSAIFTWFIPVGEFVRTDKILSDGSVKSVIIDGSFHRVEKAPQTWQIFAALFKGFVKQSEIIIFILLIGGAFWIMNATKSIDVGIITFLHYSNRLGKIKLLNKLGINNIVMILIMLIFSIFGAVFGMSEETIAFVIIFVPLAISMGYDSITGVCLVYVAAHIGFAGAIMNPFTIGIAQGISGLPIFSGLEYRIICWFIINIAGFAFILRYASKIHKKPEKSLMFHDDEYWRSRKASEETKVEYCTPATAWISYGLALAALILFSYFYPENELKIGNYKIIIPAIPVSTILFAIFGLICLRKSAHFFILCMLLFTIIFLMIGVMGYTWYVMEIGVLLFVMGILSGIAMNKSANNITKLFLEGAKDILSAALVVGLAGGIIIILSEGKIVDTIMYGLSKNMQGIGKIGSVEIMYGITTLFNLIITSASAKAALMMPILSPFSDMIGVSRQATVLAFQFGDGFTNMITPTSGVLIGVLGMARIPYQKWLKWVFPLIILLVILGAVLLVPTVLIPLNGF